ncbi:DnaB-like helicase N-terminal domain-containing protein [Nocardioides sp. SYSU D00065]|uniref:DnaB-like helicase N-terminal domain-containing protein n=1 Tax=Nocardioides sp. SYSU D00065 TaxID=2817378 RepID=UPI001B330CF8|nr:DnaB-like helicase N-terminal domain-containing protein [Nocardioides sp. SYSU D00065]
MTQDGPPTRHHLRPVTDEPPYDPAYDDTRRPPQDNAAEQAVLGALLLRPALAPELATELDGADFYRPQHETIWNAIHALADQLHGEDLAVDAVLLANHLQHTGDLDRVGGPTYLHDLVANTPLADNAHHYARIVRDRARARALVELGTRLAATGYKADPDTLDLALGDAVELVEQTALRFGPRTTTTGAGLKDLSWLLGGQPPVIPPPVYVRRDDGTALFYKGKVNGVFGDPEGGKTWLAQLAIVEALNAGQRAAMIDVDHNGPDHTAARLILLGARMEHLADADRFRYYEPEDGEELTAAVHELATWAPDVLVIDSLGEIFPMLGVNTNDTDEMTSAMRLVCSKPAHAGACVITVDHLPKSADARSTGYAIGSIAKKRMIRGAYLRVEARTKPMPGGIGKISLRIEKDTSGELRRSSHGGYAGTLVLDSTQAQVTTWTISRAEAPRNPDGSFRPTTWMEKVATYIADNPECSGRDIEAAIPGTAKTIRAALIQLITEGHVTRIKGPNRSWLHTLAIPYREAEDDLAQQSI